MSIHLILGGARSGKSRIAEKAAAALNKPVEYIATAQALDIEMRERITHHQNSRSKSWLTTEEPLLLAEALGNTNPQHVVLIDCLTLWLNNCLGHNNSELWPEQKRVFLTQLQARSALGQPIIIVSNEVGQGVVPLGELSRKFVDQAGWLHQDIAQLAEQVDFVTAGLVNVLKAPCPNAVRSRQ